jgi:cell division protein FtsB
MRRLSLDYRKSLAVRPVAYVLLAAAIIVLSDTGIRYRALTQDIAAKQARLAKASAYRGETKAVPSKLSADEYVHAKQIAWQLSMPWDKLFRTLEAAATKDVALLAIEPDVERHTVTVSGEAKDYLAALTYVAGLSEQHEAFAKVYLQHHEIRAKGQERPVLFSVSATWREQR